MSITPIRFSAAAVVALALVLGSTGLLDARLTQAAEGDVFVNIYGYIDGEQATSVTADDFAFPINATWNATSTGEGSGSFNLDSGNGYETMTVALSAEADYALEADLSSEALGASCEEEGAEFALAGYSTGATEAEAAAAAPTSDDPSFTDLTTDQHVIVWFEDCTPPVDTDAQVTIMKYLDGSQATAESAGSAAFTMNATWDDPEGVGSGSGEFTLDTTSEIDYETQTVSFAHGADYTIEEVLDDEVTGASCSEGTQYALVGYTTGATEAEAAAGTPATTTLSITDMDSDSYVIVWNETCEGETGTDDLAVVSIETEDGTGTADGTYANGWVYVFNITVPDDETSVAMRFSDWTGSAGTMAAAGNIRISSAQADNDGATVEISTADTYMSPELNITGDLDAGAAGHQIELRVEVRIPEGTDDGSYSTTYGIRTQ
ncbi:MAG TPA: hypothetical protein VEA92_01900 [Candidatus Paceibacterota bacterium]|nr:hypothetical protein [Candidatus Paceibacterota bacterium]